ncbi:MAG: phosphopantothenoylcysteine decarboxylase [Verrucomicrobiota bacterium]|jgi:phosphopantothenoylcysteine decarboxylase/phosphopantothenate--cysteine ligase|nr:phosphopantothenoylcysteine decarboxylase [Verrucomicrobiota bacterium]MDP7050907.1 phosphopantothenoylcysteine decarboxylase [Verrucomicrobiota bacterium]
MHCIVTAGPTYEPIDQVRRLTNHSTGQLGTGLAKRLAAEGHKVTLLRSHLATHNEIPGSFDLQQFTTTADLAEKLERLAKADAVFHAAAVSDFAAGQVFRQTADGQLEPLHQGKLGTRDGELLLKLKPTPKLIAHLREWFPQALLVGWKYEVDGDRDSALGQGRMQISENRTNGCVVNGPAYGEGFGWLGIEGQAGHLPGQAALFDKLSTLAN